MRRVICLLFRLIPSSIDQVKIQYKRLKCKMTLFYGQPNNSVILR